MDAVDLFAGPGGWDLAARALGIEVTGVEFDKWACRTRRAAGLPTVEGDVRDYGPADFLLPDGLIGSPPCPTFSMAGRGSGRRELDLVLAGIEALVHRETLPEFSDERTGLTLEPLRWALEAHRMGVPFQWIVLEQVPTVLPVWEAMARVLRDLGYSVVTGNLRAEQYGVPQTRRRAVLAARRDGHEARLPTPTHSRYHLRAPERLDEGVLPWVSMAEGLGWGFARRPSYTVVSNGHRSATGAEWGGRQVRETMLSAAESGDPGTWVPGGRGGERWTLAASHRVNASVRPVEEPSPTIIGGKDYNNRRWVPHREGWTGDIRTRNDTIRVSVEEAGLLQTFPADHPWQGPVVTRYQQVGNAVPPLLAHAVLSSVLSSP